MNPFVEPSRRRASSRAQVVQIIQAWSEVMNTERFLKGVQERAASLPPDERDAVLERLKLARDFVGTQNPLDFFLSWKTPLERYRPLAIRSPDEVVDEDDGDEDEDEDMEDL